MQSWPVHAFRGRGSGGQFITMHLHLHQYSIFHLHCTECTKTNFTLQPCNADTLQLFIQLQLCMRVRVCRVFGLLSQTKCNYYSVRYILNTHNFPVPLFGAIQTRAVRCVFVHIPHFSNELATLLIQSALPACLCYELHHFQTHIETHRHYIACHHTRLQ